jgi:hypothetical protein
MPVRSFMVFIFLFALLPAYAQDTLNWKQGNRLSWNDFRGKPDQRSNFLALSSTGISYSIYFTANTIQLDAEAFFVKSNSWKKPAADSSLLLHEQGHFDITEIYRRKIVKSAKVIPANVPDKAAWVSEMADKIIEQKNAFQLLYDDETRNGTDKKKQELWLSKIRQELTLE